MPSGRFKFKAATEHRSDTLETAKRVSMMLAAILGLFALGGTKGITLLFVAIAALVLIILVSPTLWSSFSSFLGLRGAPLQLLTNNFPSPSCASHSLKIKIK